MTKDTKHYWLHEVNDMRNLQILIIVGLVGAIAWVYKKPVSPIVQQNPPVLIEKKKEVEVEKPLVISNSNPSYLTYTQIVQQLKTWNNEAPNLTEVGVYGESTKLNKLYYIKLTNKNIKTNKPVVLIHGCIHGNEPLSTCCVMNYIGSMLNGYLKSTEVTELLNTRDIYFVPLLSPDSHPDSRFVDRVDPNRDFPGPTRPNHQSSKSVQAIQDLFTKIKPSAVISGHTFGRVYLYPYGYTYKKSANDADYMKLLSKMSEMSGYRIDRICNNYPTPITGTEADWYYQNGAISIVVEFGTHQKIPTKQEIGYEYDKTWNAFLHFCKEAPLIKIK